MKLGCVIQGNVRVSLGPLIDLLSSKFDLVVVSTWREDRERCPAGNYELVLCERPPVAGVTNRNLQRMTTARGLQTLREADCTHVLKWRTDMLPTQLDIEQLMRGCEGGSGNELGGRIVTGAFRHLSVEPDWFSSFPDLYSFSTLRGAQMLWSDEGFRYDQMFNMPERMCSELGIRPGVNGSSMVYRGREYSMNGIYAYDAHSELYAIFKDRLQSSLGGGLTHPEIIRRYFHLIDDYELAICWFNQSGRLPFRPIRQGYHLKWWRSDADFVPRKYSFEELQEEAVQGWFSRLWWAIPIRFEQVRQSLHYLRYRHGH